MTNPNATWLSTFNIVIFGLLFGTGYVLTGELALPIGLHFGWDFVQGFVFGVVASGNNMGRCSSSPMTRWRGCGPASLMGRRAGSWGRPPSLPASWQYSGGRDLSTAQPCWSPLGTPAADPPGPASNSNQGAARYREWLRAGGIPEPVPPAAPDRRGDLAKSN